MKKAVVLIFYFFSLTMNPAHSSSWPYFYSMEHKGKAAYLLGTVHVGAAFQDLACSDKILESLKASDLVFLEARQDLTLKLSWEEMAKALFGSFEEREKIHSRLSPEEIQTLEDSRIMLIEGLIKPTLPYQFVDEEREPPSALSPAARDFLNSRGIAVSENFVDILYSLMVSSIHEAVYPHFEFLDVEIARIAQAENKPIAALDDKSKILAELREIPPSPRPLMEINSLILEAVIENYSQRAERNKAAFQSQAEAYLRGEFALPPRQYLNEKIKEVMHSRRNRRWVKKLLEALESPAHKNVFLAAGLLHFIGDDNILEMLREEGASVRPVDCPANI